MENKIKYRVLLVLFTFVFSGIQAQNVSLKNHIKGKVVSKSASAEPLFGANVYWSGTTEGTTADFDGKFKLKRVKETSDLVISYIGYHRDTIDVSQVNEVVIELQPSKDLEQVEVLIRQKSTTISYIDPRKTEEISEKELLKAACCNLSESFETNPSVDVSFTDAVTGTRQIQMLGLSGNYVQITRENVPNIRGLSSVAGMEYVPGTWIESIQLNKGAGSVVNGFESIAGQINVELRKPEETDRLYLNAYGNGGGRTELNANYAYDFGNKKWYTGLLLHGKQNSIRWDRNNDGFLDMPLSKQFIGLNRWRYIGVNNGLRAQFGIKGTYIDKFGGELNFDPETATNVITGFPDNWGMKMSTRRLEGWGKIGKVYEDMPWKSIGLQVSAVYHDQESYFGMPLFNYDANQQSLYSNLVYQSILGNTNHAFKTGVSFMYDQYRQDMRGLTLDRTEIVPGAYFEYTYLKGEQFSMVAGIRADYHNLFGAFVTPRLHLRYAINEDLVLRASGGRGQRTPNAYAENMGLMASNRDFYRLFDPSDSADFLQPEVAWNVGLNLTQYFRLAERDGTISVDFYRTDFVNQLIVDRDYNPGMVLFYNLNGASFSNSLQAQLDYELIERLDLRIAYRWYDVQKDYLFSRLKAPFIASHRAFINLGYETENNWKFDYTLNWQGRKRIPSTTTNPAEYQLDEYSPSFFIMNAQISKKWKNNFEVYAGVENLANFKQPDPIISSSEPFSGYFDASMIWGPIFGRINYVGVRWKLE